MIFLSARHVHAKFDKRNVMRKKAFYHHLSCVLTSLIAGEYDFIATLANISALPDAKLDNINWLGFYLKSRDTLVLEPFQGKVACVSIAQGKGVCGTAFYGK